MMQSGQGPLSVLWNDGPIVPDDDEDWDDETDESDTDDDWLSREPVLLLSWVVYKKG